MKCHYITSRIELVWFLRANAKTASILLWKRSEYHANVVLAARRADLLNEIAAQIRKSGGTALVIPTDISEATEVQHLADTAISHYGKIDIWINMSGVGAIGRFWEIPLADQARLIDVNLKGMVYASRTAIGKFVSQGYGTLVVSVRPRKELAVAGLSS